MVGQNRFDLRPAATTDAPSIMRSRAPAARDPRPSQAPGTTGQEQTRKKQIIRSAATRPPVSKNLQDYAVSAERRKGTGTLTPTLLLIAQELEAQWPLAEYLDTLFF
ncbi:hypothetical protein E4U26_002155 [Claviceps purpurea]|nr:hypothetical protein E4U26_002155 [Claviceps purpurea]